MICSLNLAPVIFVCIFYTMLYTLGLNESPADGSLSNVLLVPHNEVSSGKQCSSNYHSHADNSQLVTFPCDDHPYYTIYCLINTFRLGKKIHELIIDMTPNLQVSSICFWLYLEQICPNAN